MFGEPAAAVGWGVWVRVEAECGGRPNESGSLDTIKLGIGNMSAFYFEERVLLGA